jgi:hypothetical protein
LHQRFAQNISGNSATFETIRYCGIDAVHGHSAAVARQRNPAAVSISDVAQHPLRNTQ